ncbi:MAG: hypothetical protein H3C62_18460 [Gemmatimonadaceae bacterium]|nr:hypothetical protein [Gemmatimonadaceae bacterium]
MPTPTRKSKRPKDAFYTIRVPLEVKRRAARAARRLKITRNGFTVAAMREKADAVLGAAA